MLKHYTQIKLPNPDDRDPHPRLLVDDDYTTSDSLPFEMLRSEQRILVTIAVANLYLCKQIIFELV